MRSTIMTFAMLATLIVTWQVVHWVARLIVTEFGVIGCLVSLGVCFAASVIMDRHGL